MPVHQERDLVQIELSLEMTDPRLAAMFAMFSRLNRGERPNGAEPVPERSWLPVRRRPRWRLGWFAVLIGLAAAIVPGVVLSPGPPPAPRQCPASSAPAARYAAPSFAGEPGAMQCSAYSGKKR